MKVNELIKELEKLDGEKTIGIFRAVKKYVIETDVLEIETKEELKEAFEECKSKFDYYL